MRARRDIRLDWSSSHTILIMLAQQLPPPFLLPSACPLHLTSTIERRSSTTTAFHNTSTPTANRLPATNHSMPPPSSTIPRKRPPASTSLTPMPTQSRQSSASPTPSYPSEGEDDTDFRPALTPSASSSMRTKRQMTALNAGPGAGSGKGKLTKTSREALRKANHSLIEKRRREKINSALGELRQMVPSLKGEQGDEVKEGKGKGGGEFKLEVSPSSYSILETGVSHVLQVKIASHVLQVKIASGMRLTDDPFDIGTREDCGTYAISSLSDGRTRRPSASFDISATSQSLFDSRSIRRRRQETAGRRNADDHYKGQALRRRRPIIRHTPLAIYHPRPWTPP